MSTSPVTPTQPLKGILATTPAVYKPMSPLCYVFAIKDAGPKDKLELATLGIAYRLLDVHDAAEGKTFQIRPYFSAGYRRPGGGKDDLDFPDQWITPQELCRTFREIVVYHPTSAYKTTKTLSVIVADVQKSSDGYKIPHVLCKLLD